MAKLTTRFDLIDNFSKNMKTISGSIKRFEKSRGVFNKPVSLSFRDEASKHLEKVNKKVVRFTKPREITVTANDRVTKPMKKMDELAERLTKKRSITVQTVDKITKPLKKMDKFMRKNLPETYAIMISAKDDVTNQVKSINSFLKKRMPKSYETVIKATDRTRSVLEGIRRYLGRNILGIKTFEIMARDRAMPTMHKIANYAKRSLEKGYNFTVRAIDLATKTVGRIASYTRTAIPAYRDFTIRAINQTASVIGTVKRALFSIPSMITVTLAVVGIGSLGKSTIGAAMNFQDYEVAMKHWLGGNQKQADELVSWMGRFADSTPFSSADLFPALSRGIGIADGDISKAQRYLEIASDMAAITPGRTVAEAMEAIGNAKMGEYTMLSGFNVEMSKEKFDNLGGMGALTDYLQNGGDDFLGFAGAAEEFSKTLRGQLMMLRGYTSTYLRELGDGIATSLEPRTKAITNWLENNQDTWQEWKNTVKEAGEQAGEWAFSKLEKGFKHIRNNYLENDQFKKLNFEGKVKFIMDDLGAWWDKTGRSLLADISKDVGEAIFKGVTWGITEGIKSIGSMWADFVKNPSMDNLTGAGVATAIAGSIVSLVLSPLIKIIGGFYKTGKWFWDRGKDVAGLFGKGKGPKTPTPPVASGKQPKTPSNPTGTPITSNTRGNKKPVYTNPWFDKGKKPVLNVPNQRPPKPTIFSKVPKGIDKGLSTLGKIGKFAKVPVIGTALGALSLISADKGEMPGIAGGMAGGVAGATAGAAIGSIIPGVGTLIGGTIGGIAGSFGGEALTTWVADNWENIKKGASDTGVWISDKFNEAGAWITDSWSSLGSWFKESIWSPVSKGASDSVKWIKDTWKNGIDGVKNGWNIVTDWFTSNIWDPIVDGSEKAGTWIGDAFTNAKNWVIDSFNSVVDYVKGFPGRLMISIKLLPYLIGASFGRAVATAQNLFDDLVNWVSKVPGEISDFFTETKDKVVFLVGAAVVIAKDKFNEFVYWTSKIPQKVSKWWSSLGEKLGNWTVIATDWVKGKFDDFVEWTYSLPQKVADQWGSFKELIGGWIDAALLWGQEKFNQFIEWTSSIPGRIANWWSNLWTLIGNWIDVAIAWGQEQFNTFIAWGADLPDRISDWFTSLPGKLNVWWEEVYNDATQWWGDMIDGIGDFINEIPDKISDAIGSIKEAALGIGTAIIDGIKEGWDATWSTLAKPAKWAIGKAADGIDFVVEGAKSGASAISETAKNTWNRFKLGFKTGYESEREYANGGMINRPHLGLVGEAGPEMIIPLSSNRRGRAMDLYNQTGQMLGVRPYANGGQVGGSVEKVAPSAQGAVIAASININQISTAGIEKQAVQYGESFSESVSNGINSNVISLDNWKNRNIQHPMQNIVSEAVGFGSGTVQSFSKGQNATLTNTAAHLDKEVKSPFRVIEGGASQWGAGTISGFRSGQDASLTGTRPYLVSNVHTPFEETKAKGSGWGSGAISEFVSGMRSKGAQVIEASKYLAEQVEKTFREELGIHSPSRVMAKLGQFASIGIVKGLGSVDVKRFAEGQAGSLAAAFSGLGSVGGNVQSWLQAAMMIAGVPASWLGPLSLIAQKESGGNPLAQNNWDSNAKKGTPSKGLMQTIEPTFQAHKGNGLDNILNPIHNAVAAINYIKARYGNVFNTPGIKSIMQGGAYKGYYKGTNGPLNRSETAWVGERGPELVRLPRGAEVYSNKESMDIASGSNDLSDAQMTVISPKQSKAQSTGKGSKVVNIYITGDNHFNDDIDIEKFGDKIMKIVEKSLEDEYFEGGEMVVYE